jgi:multicomponent Na+:H+ antiporter subunit G
MDILVTILELLGAALVTLAGIGLIRLPDPLTRTSAVSKAAVLGVVLMLLAALLNAPSLRVAVVVVAALALHLLTVPLGGLALGKAAFRSKSVQLPVIRVERSGQAADLTEDSPRQD